MFLLWLYVRYMEKQPFLCLKEKKHGLLPAVSCYLDRCIPGLNLSPRFYADEDASGRYAFRRDDGLPARTSFLLIITAITIGMVEELIFRIYAYVSTPC